MKIISRENIKVDDFIYIIAKNNKERTFILKILSKVNHVAWWYLKEENSEQPTFNIIENLGVDCEMVKEDWDTYILYKLNKKEINKFNKICILYNLK